MGTPREDLFMNSRDRLRNKDIGRALETELERLLCSDENLRKLRTRRRQKLIEQQLDDARPLADALRDLVQNTPELEKILQNGAAISSPFPRIGDEGAEVHQSFQSRRFPTYFRFRGKDDGADLERDVNLDNQARIQRYRDATCELSLNGGGATTAKWINNKISGTRKGLYCSSSKPWRESSRVSIELMYRVGSSPPKRHVGLL